MTHRQATALVAMLSLLSTAARADDAAFQSKQAKTALADHEAAMAKVEAEYASKLTDVQDAYVRKLDGLIRSAMSGGDFDEGKRLSELRKEAEAEPLLGFGTGADLSTTSAIAAKHEYDAASTKAEQEYEKKARKALQSYQQKLDSALRGATKKGDFDEAQRISAAKKAVEAELAPRDDVRLSEDWTVLFRSQDPTLWNTDASAGDDRYAVAVAKAPAKVRFLRLRRTDTGEAAIIRIAKADLARCATEGKYGWDGTKSVSSGGVHLGIDCADWFCQVQDGGLIMVSAQRNTRGWGFGHKIHVNQGLFFSWAGEEIPEAVLEIAVKTRALSPAERAALLQ